MSEADAPLDVLDELEHQALDLLDELRCGGDWIEVQRGSGARADAQARLDATLDSIGEDRRSLDEAVDVAARGLERVVALVARSQLEAAHALSPSLEASEPPPGGEPRAELLAEAIAHIDADPSCAGALASAVESAGVFLGLDRSSIAWAVLVSLGARADADAPALLQRCSTVLAGDLAAAWPAPAPPPSPAPSPSADAPPIARPLQVFRSAAVRLAGPELRARALAAEHPDQLDLARALVRQHADPETLVTHFEAARAALEAADADPTASIDGPKRRFTAVHVILAVIVLGLTLWHYLWR